MINENELINKIIEMEGLLFDETCYLDEGQQSSLQTLYEILDRELNKEEINRIIDARRSQMEEMLGEVDEELLLKSINF